MGVWGKRVIIDAKPSIKTKLAGETVVYRYLLQSSASSCCCSNASAWEVHVANKRTSTMCWSQRIQVTVARVYTKLLIKTAAVGRLTSSCRRHSAPRRAAAFPESVCLPSAAVVRPTVDTWLSSSVVCQPTAASTERIRALSGRQARTTTSSRHLAVR